MRLLTSTPSSIESAKAPYARNPEQRAIHQNSPTPGGERSRREQRGGDRECRVREDGAARLLGSERYGLGRGVLLGLGAAPSVSPRSRAYRPAFALILERRVG